MWSDTPIRDTSCFYHALTGVPCLRLGPRKEAGGLLITAIGLADVSEAVKGAYELSGRHRALSHAVGEVKKSLRRFEGGE